MQYYSGYNILLGNDFLKQLAKLTQTPYTVYLTTKCGHTLKIPTLKQPYRVRAKHSGHGYEQITLQIQTQKPIFTVHIIKKDDLLKNSNESVLKIHYSFGNANILELR